MEAFLLSLQVVIVAQSLLIISQIFTRPKRLVSDYALMAFFATIILVDLPKLVLEVYNQQLPPWYWLFTQATWSLIPLLSPPALWWYTVTLTALKPTAIRKSGLWHLLPFGFGCLAVIPFILLDAQSRQNIMLGAVDLNEQENLAETCLAFADLIWLLCSGAYIFSILRRIRMYRKQLKDVFASTENREMAWLRGLSFALTLFWFSLLSNMVAEAFGWPTEFPDLLSELIDVGVVWTLCIWGLRQRPGFDGIDVEGLAKAETPETAITAFDAPQKPKYEKSALSEKQAQRIAAKLETAMKVDSLYRDPMISLPTLAKHTGVSANYISQTLNVVVGKTFFEYINGWRIREAETALLQSGETVLNIAMNTGFNSRSSFYKAFRAVHGSTPSDFRKQKSVA